MSNLLFGKHPLLEAIKAKRRPIHEVLLETDRAGVPKDKSFFDQLKKEGISLKLSDRRVLDEMTKGALHQGVVARVGPYPYVSLEEIIAGKEEAVVAICDSVSDPQNFGTLCRSALCFGVAGLVVAKDRSVEVTPLVAKASAGAIEHLLIARETNLVRTLETLKKEGFWCYGADISGRDELGKLKPSPKSAVVLGSEGEGIRPLVLKNCDFGFKIPMKNEFNSLNVAQAASVIFYEFTRHHFS